VLPAGPKEKVHERQLASPASRPNRGAGGWAVPLRRREVQDATHALGLRLEVVNAHNERDIDLAFAVLEQKRVGALLIPGNAVLDKGE
jgi:hypothetical protein